MRSFITTVYEEYRNSIYRVDTGDHKTFYASLYKGDTGIFPKKIVFWFDDCDKCHSSPKNVSFLVLQFQRAIKQLNWYSRYPVSSCTFLSTATKMAQNDIF